MSPMNLGRPGRSRLIVVLAICLGLLVLGGIVVLLRQPQLPTVPAPNPNAADTYADVGQMIEGLESLYQSETSIEDREDAESLRTFVQSNAAAYAKLAPACSQECVPSVDYEQGFSEANLNESMGQFRRSTYLPRIAGRLAELEGRESDAAKQYTDLFVMGSHYGRHGLWHHAQVGLAMERLGLQRLLSLVDSLDESTRSEVKSRIEAGRHQSLDYEAMEMRDRVLANNQHGAIQASYMRFMTRNFPDQVREKTEEVEAEVLKLQSELLENL